MSATTERQGGRVQLEHSDVRLALNMAKMAAEKFLCTTIKEMQYLMKKPHAEVREEKKRRVDSSGHNHVKAAMERHLALLREKQMDGFLPGQYGTAHNRQARWKCKGTSEPPPERLRQQRPEPTPHPPGMTPVAPGGNDGAHSFETEGVPPGYVNIHTPLPSAHFSQVDAYAKDHKHKKDFNPDLLTDEGISTGLYTTCRMVMQLTPILQMTVD